VYCDLWGHDVIVSCVVGILRILLRYASYAKMCGVVENYDVNTSCAVGSFSYHIAVRGVREIVWSCGEI
jgi:hypothetical protein